MKFVVVAVRDSAVGSFSRPFFVPSTGAATRSFADEVNRAAPDNPMYAHPDDFELWRLCSFEDESGEFGDTGQVMLSRGKDVAVRG